jgi:hypothetical protein
MKQRAPLTLDISKKQTIVESPIYYNGNLCKKNESTSRTHRKTSSETTRLLGLDYNQLIGLITHAENLYNQQKKVQDNSKIRIIKGGGGRPPKLEIATKFS